MYDASGNVFKAYGFESETQSGRWTRIDDQAIHYWGPDERLRVFIRHMGLGAVSAAGGVVR